MNKIIKKETEFNGKPLVIETGELALQADMAVKVSYGDTVVLATVVSSGPNPDLDYFPLSVNYFEKLYATGTIKSSRFVKRDGRPTDEAIINRRLIDHAIRPLFPQDEGFMDDVQVAVYVMALDPQCDAMFTSMIAVSAALHASNIPWAGPMSSARVGYDGDKYLLNPPHEVLENESELDLLVSFVGEEKRFLAMEAEANLLPEEVILGAIKFAQDNVGPALDLILDFTKEVNPKSEKYEYESKLPAPEVMEDVSNLIKDEVVSLIEAGLSKGETKEKKQELMEKVYTEFDGKYKKVDMERAFVLLQKDALKHLVLDEGKRADGRAIDEIRDLSGRVGVLPRVHGSSVFTRGQTQVMNIATLGSPSMEQIIQDMYGERTKRFMHYYEFPPFSVGETGRMGFAGGREIGHGMLAERALKPVIPSQKEFPYTVMLMSHTLESNGSSSMASACASTLTLMDAGVPIKAPVAGIGVGLITNEDFSNYKILTDLTGLEDGSGYMDFKMTGTREGVTAIQVDIKAKGLAFDMLPEIFKRSNEARMKVLDTMASIIEAPRDSVSEFAPKSTTTQILPDQIGMVIGSGGKVIKSLQEDTNTVISIEDDGSITVSGQKTEEIEKAKEMIDNMTRVIEAGEVFEGVVEELADYGAFVEILPGKTGLLHVSEITNEFVDKVTDHLKPGDKVKVKVLEVSRDGKYSLSAKALLPGYEEKPRSNNRGRGNDRGNSRGGRNSNNRGRNNRDKGRGKSGGGYKPRYADQEVHNN